MCTDDIKKLFQKAKEGDNIAFGTIYETYFTQIFRYIYYRVRDRELAEDLVQTVFINVFSRIEKIDNKYPKAYLFTVARNAITDYWRRKKYDTFDDTDERIINRLSEDTMIEQRITDKQDMDRILKVLDTLSEDHQDIVRFKFIHDFTNAEIAKIMGKNEVSIRQLQCRVLKLLRNRLSII